MNVIYRLIGHHLTGADADRVSYLDTHHSSVLTYRQLYEAARQYAALLAQHGVVPGARCMVVSDDSIAAVAAVFGMWWRGCVPVPVSPALREDEIVFIAGDCAARAIHLDVPAKKRDALVSRLGGLAVIDGEEVRAALPNIGLYDYADPATFALDSEVLAQYTSGSTGTPRGVRHGLCGIETVLAGFGGILGLRPADTVLSTAKLSFGYGFGNSVLFPLAAGARVVLLGGAVDPYTVATALSTHRPTVLCSVPRLYAGLLDLVEKGEDIRIDSVRMAVSAGEYLPAALAKRFQQTFGMGLVNGLGATELLHIVIATDPSTPSPGSTGIAVPGVIATVRDESGRVVPDGTEGRLHIASGSVALGYIDRPDAAAKTFVDGGAYTGDIVRCMDNGEFEYFCRADDLLNLGGFKIAPTEIETVVRKTDGVADCAVVAETDSDGLQRAVAFAVPADGVDRDKLRQLIVASFRAHLAPFKRPSRIEVVSALPVTSTGKLARFKLRAAWRDR